MPTLPEQLSSLLDSSNISSDLQGQLGMITDAANLLSNLITNPPTEIDDLLTSVSSVSVTNIQLPDSISGGFSNLTSIIPADPGSVTGNVDELLSGFSSFSELDILEDIQSYVSCLQGVAGLLSVDFSKFDISTGAGSSSGSSTSGGSDGSPSAPPETPETGPADGSGATAETGSGEAAATGSAAAAATKDIGNVLNSFPQPFNAENVVRFLRDLLKSLPRKNMKMRHVPVYDDLLQLFDIIIQFDGMSSAQLQTHVQSTITALAVAIEREGLAPVDEIQVLTTSIEAQINFTQLNTAMNAVSAALDQIGSDVDGGDVSTIDSQLTIVNDSLDLLLPQLDTLINSVLAGPLEELCRDVQQVARNLDIAIRRLQRMLQPAATMDLFSTVEQFVQESINHSGIQKLNDDIRGFLKQISNALALLESSTVKDALGTVSGALETALDEFDAALLQVAAQVSALFDEVDGALEQVDTAAFRQQITAAIQEVQDTLEDTIGDLFEPIREAVTTAVTAIDGAVESFDPNQIADVLRDVIQEITDVLLQPEVKNAIDQIRNTLETVTQEIQSVSFGPVVDEVINGIDEIKDTLQEIDPAQLNDIIKAAIKAAIKVLPEDLEEPRSWLTSELDRLIDEGPKPLIEKVKEPVAKLTDQITGMTPEKLIGTSLSGPFEAFIAELDTFKPSTLMEPIQDGLDKVKDEIGDQIDLAVLLKPLEDLFGQLLSQFDRFGPEQIIEPIENQITALIDGFLEILPEEVIFEVLDSIISSIEAAAEFVAEIKNLLVKVQGMIAELANPQDQLTNWMQPVFNAIDSMPDIPDLNTLFTDLDQAVNKLKQAALIQSIETAIDPLLSGINTLQPQNLHTTLSTAYRNINRPVVEGLADSPQKTALLNTLDRFNPMNPNFSRVFSKLEEIKTKLDEAMATTEQGLLIWDERHFAEGNPFSDLQLSTINMQALKDLMRESIEQQAIEPVAKILSTVGGVFSVLDGPIEELTTFVENIEEVLTDITEGPDSLGEIRDTLAALVDRVRNINLQFLEDELNEVFDAVKQKFEDLSPTMLREELEVAIEETLDAINIGLLLPEPEIAQIDKSYQDLIDKLKAIDPSKLVIDAVTPEYDEKIQPILKSFDLVAPIDALLLRMDELGQELNQELSRADQSYKSMLQAVPA